MKGHIVAVTIALVMSISAITANVRWSEAQQETMPVRGARQAAEQATSIMPGAEETPVPGGDFNSSPVMFIENAGQWDDGARFQVWGGPGGTMWLAEDAIWITVLEPRETSRQVDKSLDPMLSWLPGDREDPTPRSGVNIKLSFVGANPHPRIETFNRLDTKFSYFYGNDPNQWQPDVPVWGNVRYVDLYPGVDLELTSEAGQMTPRLAARPGADLDAVRLRVGGADAVATDGNVLHLSTTAGEFTLPLLRADGLQLVGSKAKPSGAKAFDVVAPFVSANSNPKSKSGKAPADNSADLLYGTFLGGSSDDWGWAIAVDGTGSAYVTGETWSSNLPTTPGAFDPSYNVNVDAFVVKLNPAGSGLTYATFLGGGGIDESRAIVVDGVGRAYVTGHTQSSDFPTTPGAFDTSFNGWGEAFVVNLNPAGSGLTYATFLGGSSGRPAIAVDGAGSAYVTGETGSSDFPTTPGAFDTSYNGHGDAFVVKLNPTGSGLAYATFLGGGSNSDAGRAIAVDGAGRAYVTGYTKSSDFPTTPGAYDQSHHGIFDAFVVKLNPTGSGLVYATFLGGSDYDAGSATAVDGAGSAYVTGWTISSDFPTTPGAFDTSFNGWEDAFVVKLNPAGSELAYATFLGSSSYNEIHGRAIAVDGTGSAHVTGYTMSDFLTTPGAFDTSYNGGYSDAFVAKLNPIGSGVAYATFLGGSGYNGDYGNAITIDGTGRAYIAGSTNSSNFPTTPGAFDQSYNGGSYYGDAFVVKLALEGGTGPTPTPTATPTATPTPAPTHTISGRVTDINGHGIPGVTVQANSAHNTTTGSNGNYILTGLSAGSYIVTPSKSGYTFSPASRTISVPPNATGVNFTSYDKPPIVFVHGWHGGNILNWSCDWVEPDGYFQGTDNLLHDAGYYVEYARLESSTCYTPPIEENVWRLDNAIQLAKAATNQSQVILIGHSMGGLVSRAYLEGPDYDDDVTQLFTFGSPHRGVPIDFLELFANGQPLATYCRLYQPAVCDFSYRGMQRFNRDHPDRAANVIYHVVSGDAPRSPRTVFGMVANVLLDGADDGAVQTWSGTGLSGHLDRWQTDETHGPGSGSRNYFVRDEGSSTSYLQCLTRLLVDGTTDHCGTVGSSEEVLPITPTSPKHSPFLYGTLLPGQTNIRSITVEGGETLFAAQWQPGTVLMTLIDPSGQTIDPAYAAAHPGIVTYQESAGYATYSFPNAFPGTWQVSLQAISVPAPGASYTAFAAFDSALALSAGTDRPWYTPGATATISATLSPVPQSAAVSATILLSDSASTTVTLTPLGGGRYQGSYLVPATPGYAEVRLSATGVNANGVSFERGTSLAFQISPNTVALNGSYSDTPEPRWPGASIYQALKVSVGVNVNTTGSYGLSADLVDGIGNSVAHSNVVGDLSSGARTLELRFSGTDIYSSQRNGPYTLTNLLLTDHNGATLVAQEAQNVYTTAAYRYRDFRTGDMFLPLIMR